MGGGGGGAGVVGWWGLRGAGGYLHERAVPESCFDGDDDTLSTVHRAEDALDLRTGGATAHAVLHTHTHVGDATVTAKHSSDRRTEVTRRSHPNTAATGARW